MKTQMANADKLKKTSLALRESIHRRAKVAATLSSTAKSFQEWAEEAFLEKLEKEEK